MASLVQFRLFVVPLKLVDRFELPRAQQASKGFGVRELKFVV